MKKQNYIMAFVAIIFSSHYSFGQIDSSHYGGQDRYTEVLDSIYTHIPFDSLDENYLFDRSFTILELDEFKKDSITNFQVLQLQNTLNEAKKNSTITDLTYFTDSLSQPKRENKFDIDILITEHDLPFITRDSLKLINTLDAGSDNLPVLKNGKTVNDLIETLPIYQFALTKKKIKNIPNQEITFNFSTANHHNFTDNSYSYAIKIGNQTSFTPIAKGRETFSYTLSSVDSGTLPIVMQWKNGNTIVAEKTHFIYLSKYQAKSATATNIGSGIDHTYDYSFTVTHDGFSATAYYDLVCGEKDFTHPLIFVEGFDFFDDFSYIDGYYQLGGFYSTYNPNNMDFVVIDFEYGTGDLYKNAELVKMIIREINKRKWANGSTQKNIVMGHSMGGILSRMVLRDMEIWGENHDASDYISIDAPHLGANVPVSLQYMIQDYIDLVNTGNNVIGVAPFILSGIVAIATGGVGLAPALTLAGSGAATFFVTLDVDEDAINLTSSMAAGQMSLYRINDNSAAINFRSHLQNIGYPQQTVNHGISNGNSAGNGNGAFNPSDKILHLKRHNSLHHVRFDCWATPWYNTSNSLLFESKVSIGTPVSIIASLFGSSWGYIKVWHTKKRETNYGQDLYPYDSAPAGHFLLSSVVSSDLTELFNIHDIKSKFSFIPVFSALGMSSQITNPYYQFGSTDISSATGTAESPFDRVKIFKEITSSIDNTYNHRFLFSSGSNFIQDIVEGTINTPIGSTLINSFNFGTATNGNRTNKYIGSTTINSGVTLSIQKNINIGYSGSSQPAKDYHHFVLETKKDCNGTPVNITFKSGSSLETGNGWGYTGDFIINSNATVRFKSGSTLRLRDHSQLIVRSGGRLIIEPNVNIILEGDNSVMRFMDYETLELTDNCIFKMDDKGHLAFHGGWNPNYPNSIIFGQNSKLEIIGDSYNYDDKILELHGLWKIGGNISNKVKLRKGYVSIDPEQHVSIDVPVYFNRVLFKCSNDNEKFADISFWGQKNILISSCKFHNAHTGITNNAGTSIHPLNVQNSQFLNCDKGMVLQGGKASVKNSQFVYPMGIGIKGDGLVNDSEFEDNQFLNGVNIAMVLKGQTGSNVIVKENEIFSISGFLTQNINLNLRCNDFQTTLQNLLLNGGSLTMNDEGVNSFHNSAYNTPHILLNNVRYLATNGGENEFGNSNKYISGTLLPSALAVDFYTPTGGSPNTIVYKFNNNRYSSGKLNITIPTYSIQIDHTNQPATTLCPPDPIIINIPQVSSTLPNINSTYFSHLNLMIAMQMAMEQTTNTIISNPNEMACRYFIDILEHYPTLSNRDLKILHRFAYEKMHETFNMAFANAEIPKNTSNTNTVLPDLLIEANTYINSQIALLQPSISSEAQQISKYIIDKAFLNRSAGFYHYAEILLGQSENFEDLEMLARSQYWNCLMNSEKQLYYGTISEIEFLKMDKACEQNYSNAKIIQTEDIETNADYIQPSSESHFIVLKTLNGVEAIGNKWIGNKIELLNSLGQHIETKSIDNQLTIRFDLSTYSKGVYFISNGNKAEKIVW